MNGLARNNSMTKPAGSPWKWLAGLTFAVLAPINAAYAAPCASSAAAVLPPVSGQDPDAARAAVAAQAEAASHVPGPYPDFCSIPPAPTDLRSPTAWAASVGDLSRAADETRGEAQTAFSDNPPTDNFVGDALRDSTPPPALTTPSSTEDFARSLRNRATAPSRPR